MALTKERFNKLELLIRDVIKQGEEILKAAGIVDWKIDSWLLAEYVFDINRTVFYMNPNMNVDTKLRDKYIELINLRALKTPLQYITGKQEFMGLDFIVNENVLIPRQDTELLVEKVVEHIKTKKEKVKVLDMCTGSGCIAISIDKLCENARVFAADVSEKALDIAKKNNELNNTNVTFIQSDLFTKIQSDFDIIVSNPPYIKTKEIEALMDEVRVHEPRIALDGSADGLKFYKKIAIDGRQYLRKNGIMFLEIGYDQGLSVPEILDINGYTDIKVYKDLADNDRVVIARKE